MKKLLIAIALALMPALQAEPVDAAHHAPETGRTESQTALLVFTAKFRVLHAMQIEEYTAIKELLEACAHAYNAVYEPLETISVTADQSIKDRASQIDQQMIPLGHQLVSILEEVNDVNKLMEQFNALPVEEKNFTQLTQILIAVLQEMKRHRETLESILEQEKTLASQAHALIAQDASQ